jgi:cytochrome b6-f complex iron-sulfur subunit
MEKKDSISRRTFLDNLLLVTGVGVVGAAGYPVAKFILPPEQSEPDNLSTTASNVGDLAKGDFKIFEFNRKPAIIVRTGSDAKAPESYHALSAVCPHLQCTVQYQPESGQILCACHNGHFNLQGKVLSGPPPKPLPSFKVDIRNDKIIVSVESA